MTIEYEDEVLGLRYASGEFYPLAFHDDAGELVGFYGKFSEVRFLPSYNGRRGSLTTVNRRLGNHATFNIYDFHVGPTDPPGPDKPRWSEYVGEYELLANGQAAGTVRITVKNGYLYVSEDKCTEYEPGLFFTFDGEVLDLRSDPPTAANMRMRKK